MNYIKRTFNKLNEEILGKALYDLLKYGFILLAGLITSAAFLGWMSITVSLPLWSLLILITLTVLVTSVIWAKIAEAKLNPLVKSNRTDELTQLLNTHALQEDLVSAIDNARRLNEPLSLILLDIDDFKLFNTNYNSIIADKVLFKLGELLSSDKRITDAIYRQHTRGDEFVIITQKTSLTHARIAAERKHKTIAETGLYITGYSKPLHLTVCCAIVELSPIDTKESLLERASIAMNRAKECPGKNRIESLV